MPGIIDAHAHVGGESSGLSPTTSWPFARQPRVWRDDVHDPSNDTETDVHERRDDRRRRSWDRGSFRPGRSCTARRRRFKAVIEYYEDALCHLRRMKAVGAVSA